MDFKTEIIIRPEAEQDIKEAFKYYEECSIGLCSDFLLAADTCLSIIQGNVNIYQVIYKKIRRGLIRKFPYGIFYFIDKKRSLY